LAAADEEVEAQDRAGADPEAMVPVADPSVGRETRAIHLIQMMDPLVTACTELESVAYLNKLAKKNFVVANESQSNALLFTVRTTSP
jgi:hypothetical protein